MVSYNLVIIGGGAAGLSAGVEALKRGVKNVLIIERNNDLGGNLNVFIHKGFGEYYLGEEVTGPELSSFLIREYKYLGGKIKVETQVLEITKGKVIYYVNPKEGVTGVCATTIIIASGCRDRYTGNIIVPIHKYTGIFTVGSAHRLVNIDGYLPGKEVVILGKSKWTLILARRLIIEGAKIKAVIDNSSDGFITEEDINIIECFDIPIVNKSNVIEILGNERIEAVGIKSNEDGSIKNIECDSLILSVGYFPEIDFLRKAKVCLDNDKLQLITNNYETSIKGIYACGTVLNGADGIDYSGEEGKKVGGIVAQYLEKYIN
ncbi:MAG: FAD-dependent oxidoreductase [Terrisporobacter sp.]